MNALAQLAQLSEPHQALFADLARHFVDGKAFTRTGEVAPGGKNDTKWRFLVNNYHLFVAYFQVLGWSFELRKDLGAAVVRPRQRRHTHFFPAYQTHVVYHMVAQHHEMNLAGSVEARDATMTVGDLLERVARTFPAGPRGEKADRTSLEKMFSKLRSFGALTYGADFTMAPSDVLTIYPVIELLLSRAEIEAQLDHLRVQDTPVVAPDAATDPTTDAPRPATDAEDAPLEPPRDPQAPLPSSESIR